MADSNDINDDTLNAFAQQIQRLIEIVNNIPDAIKSAMVSSAMGIGRNLSSFVGRGNAASGIVPAALSGAGQASFGAAQTLGQVAATASQTGAAGMAVAAGAASSALAGIGVVASAAAKSLGAMQSATESMTKRLSQFSPQVASIQARNQMLQVFRDQKLGAQLAPEIAQYEQSKNVTAAQFDESTKEIYRVMYKLLTVLEKVEAITLKTSSWILDTFWPVVKAFVDAITFNATSILETIIKFFGGEKKKPAEAPNMTPAAAFINRLAGGGLQNRKQKLAENKAVK